MKLSQLWWVNVVISTWLMGCHLLFTYQTPPADSSAIFSDLGLAHDAPHQEAQITDAHTAIQDSAAVAKIDTTPPCLIPTNWSLKYFDDGKCLLTCNTNTTYGAGCFAPCIYSFGGITPPECCGCVYINEAVLTYIDGHADSTNFPSSLSSSGCAVTQPYLAHILSLAGCKANFAN